MAAISSRLNVPYPYPCEGALVLSTSDEPDVTSKPDNIIQWILAPEKISEKEGGPSIIKTINIFRDTRIGTTSVRIEMAKDDKGFNFGYSSMDQFLRSREITYRNSIPDFESGIFDIQKDADAKLFLQLVRNKHDLSPTEKMIISKALEPQTFDPSYLMTPLAETPTNLTSYFSSVITDTTTEKPTTDPDFSGFQPASQKSCCIIL